MKKLLGSTLALAMLIPAGANAELLKNLKVTGQIDIQATSGDNIGDLAGQATAPSQPNGNNNDHIGSAFTRTMVSADWDLLDDVHAKVGLVKGDNWWSSPRAYGSNNSENITALESNTYVHEAYIKVDKLFGAVDATMGRQYWGNPGDIIAYFGPTDAYGLSVRPLDAFRFDWNGEKVGLTFLFAKPDYAGGNGLGTNQSSVNLRALVASFKGNDMVSGSAYVYNQESRATGQLGNGNSNGKSDYLYIVGLKGKTTMGGLTVGGEIAKDLGQNRVGNNNPGDEANYSGWALLANAAFKAEVRDAAAVTPWAEFAYGSGRSRRDSNHNDGFVAIQSDYRPGGIYGRFDALTAPVCLGGNVGPCLTGNGNQNENGLSNRVIYGAGVKATPAALSKLTVGAQFWKYAFARTSDTSQFADQTPRSIGTEEDVTAEWKHSENVSLKATVGRFQPGAYVYFIRQPSAAVKPATMASLDTSVRF